MSTDTSALDIDFSELNEREFRDRFRAFLTAHPPSSLPKTDRLERTRAWARILADHGWAAPSWPREYGGMNLPIHLQLPYHQELTAVRAPGRPDTALGMVAPTLIRHGTDEQKRRFLPGILRTDDLWCQGFSEPDAGSDLPSLRTRAVRDGDEYVVSGQKIWTTNALQANWCFALVRTGPDGSRQHGISYVLIEMSSPGVEVRPLPDMTGGVHFAETFFDNVRVPVSNRVGEENEGWNIARTTLGHERSTSAVAGNVRYTRIVEELQSLARQLGRADDPVIRQRLAAVYTEFRLMTLNDVRTLENVLRTGEPGPASSLSRLQHALFEQQLHELAVDLAGAAGMLFRDPHEVERGRWVRGFLHTRASTIGGGTAEVQRNTIAERVLGLPHDAGMPA